MAHLKGLEETVPRTGCMFIHQGVWLEIFPFYKEYTWALVLLTLSRVEERLRSEGWYWCYWQISVIEEGRLGRIYGKGEMWPQLPYLEMGERGTTAYY